MTGGRAWREHLSVRELHFVNGPLIVKSVDGGMVADVAEDEVPEIRKSGVLVRVKLIFFDSEGGG